MIHRVKQLFHYIHFLGLDAPFVAVGWQAIAADFLGCRLEWFHYAILLTGTWAVYLGDRLADSAKYRQGFIQQPRHDFTGFHRDIILVLAAICLCLCAGMSGLFLQPKEIVSGIIFAVATSLYFVTIHQRRWAQSLTGIKEAGVSIFFACGAVFFPFIDSQTPDLQSVWAFVVFVLLCFSNCLLITLWEEKKNNPRLEFIVCLVPGLVAVAGSLLFPETFFFILQALAAACLWILSKRLAPSAPQSARVWADAVLLVPALWLII